MKSNYRRIGDFIELVDERNKKLEVTTLVGLSISKEFIPSVANTVGTNMANYKIIRKNQFACSLMQVRRDKKIPVALLQKFDEAIISQAYPVFQIKDESELLPQYLMMWMSRSEFDRHACFLAVGGVRGSLEWDDFCDMELPIPSIEEQREIVKEYNTIVNRIKLNEQLNQKLEETAQALYKHWFVDFEFPNTDGKPYKSSGGKMVFNAELDKEIPEGWEANSFTKVINFGGGGTPSTVVEEYWNGDVPFYTPGDLGKQYYCIETSKSISELGLSKCSSKLYPRNTVFLTARGATVGGVALSGKPMAMNQTCYAIWGEDNSRYFAHQLSLWIIYRLKSEAIGATFEALVTKDFDECFVIKPPNDLRVLFNTKVSVVYDMILSKSNQNMNLDDFKFLILSKMTKVETEKEAV